MAETVVLAGVNYTIPDPGDQPNWGTGLTPYLVALAANVASAPAFMQPVAVSSSPTTMVSGKTYLVTTASIAITLNLPAPATNMWMIIHDVSGAAATHNITVHRPGSQTIDGTAADKVLSRNFGTWIISSDGTNYFTLNEFPDTGLVAGDYAAGSISNVAINAAAAIAFSKMAALSNNLLARSNGSGVVVSDVVTSDGAGNLGAVASLASTTANRAAAGVVRLANADSINWRNNANSADKILSVDTSDRLLYAGAIIANAAGAVNLANVTGTLAIGNGGTNSASALANGLLMVSNSGAIKEIAGNVSAGSNKITSLANGTAATDAAAFGQLKVIQIIFATNSSTFSTTSASYQTTNLSATITPTSASNKVLVIAFGESETGSGGYEAFFTIARGGSNLLIANGQTRMFSTAQLEIGMTLGMIDAPASTSALTYAVQMKSDGTHGANFSDGQAFMILAEVVA